jgi:hypothetical protein
MNRYQSLTASFVFVCAFAFALALVPGNAWAADRDLHDYWDARCASCHGHAADFARKFLRVENGKLIGTHHRDNLDVFLRTHHLTPDLYAPTIAMLKAQVATVTPLFKTKCSGCHAAAAEFARKSLEMRKGVLTGKKSEKPVIEYLKTHGKVTSDEATSIVETLTRVLSEVRVNS